MPDARIAFIAIRSGDGARSDGYEAIVVGTGEGGGLDWRYAIFDLPKLRNLFTQIADANRTRTTKPPHPLSSQTDILKSQFNARWYEEVSIGALLGDDEATNYAKTTALNAPQTAYLAEKVGSARRYQLSLPLRDIVKVVFYRGDLDGQPIALREIPPDQPLSGPHLYYDERRKGGPLALLDTCRNVIAKGGTSTPEKPKKYQEQDTGARSHDRLGSRLLLLLDSSRGRGALSAFAIFAQVRLPLNGHDLQGDPTARDAHDTRGFVEAFAFPALQQNGGVLSATPRDLWKHSPDSFPGDGATFDILRVGFTLAPYNQTRGPIWWTSYCDANRDVDLTRFRDQAVNNAAPAGYIPVLDALDVANYQGSSLVRFLGFRTVDASDRAVAQEDGRAVRRIGLRFEAQITGPGPELSEAFASAAPSLARSVAADETLYFAQEQPLGTINWNLSPATNVRWILTVRFRFGATLSNGALVTQSVVDLVNGASARLHSGLRRAKDARPLSFVPGLDASKAKTLDWHYTGWIIDSRPFDRTVEQSIGAGFLTLEPRFIGDMWNGFKRQSPYSDGAGAIFGRMRLTRGSVPGCDVMIHAPQTSNPRQAEPAECAVWPAWQPAVSAGEPSQAPRGLLLGLTISKVAAADPFNTGMPKKELDLALQKLRVGALQMMLSKDFGGASSGTIAFDRAGSIRIARFATPKDWDGDRPFGAVGIDARIKFPVSKVGPGDQDALPGADTTGPDQLLADPLADPDPDPDVPLVFPLEPGSQSDQPPVMLVADETVARGENHTLGLALKAQAKNTDTSAATAAAASPPAPATAPKLASVLVLDPKPFRVAVVGYRDLVMAQTDSSNEIAVWNAAGENGLSWRVVDDEETVRLLLPPQVIGEAMEKNRAYDPADASDPNASRPPDINEKAAAAARFGSPTRLDIDPSYFDVRYVEPGWNLRRILGYPGQRAPGSGVRDLRLELIYGMITRLTPGDVSIAEVGATLGAPATVPAVAVGGDEPKLAAYLDLFRRFRAAEGRRLAADKLWSGRPELDLTIEDGARFRLRGVIFERDNTGEVVKIIGGPSTPLRWPVPGGKPNDLLPALSDTFDDSDSDDASFPGGISWAFESDNILRSVYGAPDSNGGYVKRVYLSALGGWGQQRAQFDEKRQAVESTTTMGRVHRYALERIGRIGCLWHRAKHVIVYERTVVPGPQFYNIAPIGKQQDELLGRPVLRKVAEYIQLLEPVRRYPEKGNAIADPGCLVGAEFKSLRINVDSRWGGDVRREGWEVPLWNKAIGDVKVDPANPDSPAFIYPKPHIRALLAGAEGAETACEMDEPEKLVFYTSVVPGESGDNTDLWRPVRDVDFVDLPLPVCGKRDPAGATLSDGIVPKEPDHVPGYERFTIGLVRSAEAAAITYGRQDKGPVAILKNLTIARATDQKFDPAASHVDVKAKLAQTITAETNKIRASFDGVAQVLSDAARITTEVKDATTVTSNIKAALKSAGLTKALAAVQVPLLGDVVNVEPGKTLCSAQVDKLKAASDQQINRARTAVDNFLGDLDRATADADLVARGVEGYVRSLPVRAGTITADDLAKAKNRVFALLDGLVARVDNVESTGRIALNRGRSNVQQIVGEAGGRLDALQRQVLGVSNEGFGKALQFLDQMIAAVDMTGLKASCNDAIVQLRIARAAVGRLTSDIGRANLPESAKRAILATDSALVLAQKKCTDILALANSQLAIAKGYAQDAQKKLQQLRDAVAKRVALGSGSDVAAALGTKIDGIADLLEQKLHGAADGLKVVFADARTKVDIPLPNPADVPAVQSFCNRIADQIARVASAFRNLSLPIKQAFAADATELKAVLDAVGATQQALITDMNAACQAIEGELDTIYQAADGAQKWVNGALNDYREQVEAAVDKLAIAAGETLADFAKRAQETVNGITGDMEARSRELLGGIRRRATEILGQDPAAVFQQGTNTLRLLRALGDPPKSDQLGFNKPEVAYVFNEVNKIVDMSPAIALVNRVADSYAAAQAAGQAVDNLLTSFGIRLPMSAIGDQLMPDALKNLDVSKLFPDFSGLKLDGLLKSVGFPDLKDSDAVKVRHGFDKAELRAWLEADVDVPFASSAPILEFGPVQVVVDGARFTARARLSAGRAGTEKRMNGNITGDWRLAAAGQTILTFRQTGLFFDDTGKLDFRIQPERVELAEVLQFLTTLVQASGRKGELQIIPYMRGGIPAGVAASLDLDLPDIQSGAFGISHLSLHVLFGVLAVPQFELAAELAIAAKTAPFTLNVWLLNGGGFVTTRLSYLPMAKPQPLLMFTLEIGIVAGVGIGFSFGVISGGVWVQVGCSIAITWTTQGGGSSTAVHVFILVRGNVDVAGLITAAIALLMDVSYDGDRMIGSGSLDFSIKISVFYTFHVSEHVEYQFAGSKKKEVGNYADSHE
jgi:hypothetical protein